MAETLNDKIDRLLHDAEHAESGMLFVRHMARMQPHNAALARYAEEASQKRARLLREALELDPGRTAPAWQETDLSLPTEQETPAPGRIDG